MKATEMRKVAKEAVNSEIEGINSHIEIEAKRGKTQITVNGVSQGAKAYLTDEGYEISEITHGEFSSIVIRW